MRLQVSPRARLSPREKSNGPPEGRPRLANEHTLCGELQRGCGWQRSVRERAAHKQSGVGMDTEERVHAPLPVIDRAPKIEIICREKEKKRKYTEALSKYLRRNERFSRGFDEIQYESKEELKLKNQ
ncbi:hypothetical protein NDU88_009861 [Pleurodeles waltl]|uniref:Uncharacterized protein n=1 Tax=Pleurodeles waltl TaxID=8319 RepID=A0AAV7RWF2_PLEWA|nr:hypothetical protein NDU88_009861 [Pleurodeles waltl]